MPDGNGGLEDPQLDLADIPLSLGFFLRIAQLQVFEQFHDNLSDLGMRPGEFTVLRIIQANPGAVQGTIARVLHIKAAHMTKLVARFVENGMVERTGTKNDRRQVRLSLTEAGHAYVDANLDVVHRQHKAERRDLSDADFAQLMELLRKYTGYADV